MAELLLKLGRSCFMEITSDTNHDLTGSCREWQEPVFLREEANHRGYHTHHSHAPE